MADKAVDLVKLLPVPCRKGNSQPSNSRGWWQRELVLQPVSRKYPISDCRVVPDDIIPASVLEKLFHQNLCTHTMLPAVLSVCCRLLDIETDAKGRNSLPLMLVTHWCHLVNHLPWRVGLCFCAWWQIISLCVSLFSMIFTPCSFLFLSPCGVYHSIAIHMYTSVVYRRTTGLGSTY